MTISDSEPVSPAAETDLPAANPAFRNAKILVIDDTAEIRMIITESLKMHGLNTLAAEDGRSGVEMARQHCPDLIICDINMPHMDGYATLMAIRNSESTATTPFIFLSGAAEKPNVRRGMELGADDYLTKPFTQKELLTAVNTRLLKQAEVQRQSERKLDELRGNITLALPHELRTPLHGILGLATLMMEDYGTMPPEEVLENSRFIHQAASRLHHLIENFLIYSQMQLLASDTKQIELPASAEPVRLQEAILPLAHAVAERHQRLYDLKCEVEPGELRVPEDNFKKIIEEIVDNAFKFSEPGQPVSIVSESARHGLTLTITDQGRGMTAEQIANIAPHMQFDRRIYEQQGAGLGLVIAQRFTELLGGEMTIESQPGVKTTVRICFSQP